MAEAWVRAGIADGARPAYARPIAIRAKALRAVWSTVAGLATRPVAPGEDFNPARFDKAKYGNMGRCARGMHLLGNQRNGFCGWTRRPLWAAAGQTDALLRRFALAIATGEADTHEPNYSQYEPSRRAARARWQEPPAFCPTPTPKLTDFWPARPAGAAAARPRPPPPQR
eukprot:gene7153-19395_t